jgi:hypothetical protein
MSPAIITLIFISSAVAQTYRLDSLTALDPLNVKPAIATYRGHRAVHLIDTGNADPKIASGALLAVLTGSDFKDGTIDVDVSGAPAPGAPGDARGFVGIAFRVQPDRSRYECFYLRPTNGRADDQLRRNHSVQYVSEPEFPWARLRQETPGVYESYTDLEPGVWTHMKIVVTGIQAQLYVNHAPRPCLIVRDIKHGETHGQIALWAGPGTDGYFSKLVISPK